MTFLATRSNPLPPVEILLLRFSYDQQTGLLYRTLKDGRTVTVGFVDAYTGYTRMYVGQKLYAAHRVIWKMWTGSDPQFEIDHINGNKSDNRICNLRDATRSQNSRNKPMEKRNSSGFKGITKSAADGRWNASIRHDGKKMHIGSFGTPQEAHEAYWQRAQELHGEFARRM